METVFGVLLLVFAVFLIAAILLQSSKSHKLPGTIAGGAETFFGKTKGSKLDRLLGIATSVVAIIFCVLVIVMYVIQDTPMTDYNNALLDQMNAGTTTEAAEEDHDHDHDATESDTDAAVESDSDVATESDTDAAPESDSDVAPETDAVPEETSADVVESPEIE